VHHNLEVIFMKLVSVRERALTYNRFHIKFQNIVCIGRLQCTKKSLKISTTTGCWQRCILRLRHQALTNKVRTCFMATQADNKFWTERRWLLSNHNVIYYSKKIVQTKQILYCESLKGRGQETLNRGTWSSSRGHPWRQIPSGRVDPLFLSGKAVVR